MDIRLEILRVNGNWSLTQSGPDLQSFATQGAAIKAGVAPTCLHHEQNGGQATVLLWEGGQERVVFNTGPAETQRTPRT